MRILFFLFSFVISHMHYAQDCSQTSTNFIPLADLGKNTFEGFTGGKYPGGSNAIPSLHYNNGLELSQQIQPLNKGGETDISNGKIGFIVLGFSTAAMTGRYVRNMHEIINTDSQLKIIIGAQGGRDINAMTSEKSDYWIKVDSALRENDMSAEQVQIIWLSSSDVQAHALPFPAQSNMQAEKYRMMLQNIKRYYPNIKIVFLSDRTYAGYIGNDAGPQELKEPTAYYNSWAVKWVIEKQIMNEAGYTRDVIPFIDWGTLLWTNGETGNEKGYTWDCTDAGKGGIHPSAKGRAKEATRVYLFFRNHPYTQKWFN
ncbi:MAG: SGNH/GDSL hydrolase family protein [Chitinophagales bacterium]|nr:SGNH/GDSL hydrolase family protein [Chitinophagales bacterium]